MSCEGGYARRILGSVHWRKEPLSAWAAALLLAVALQFGVRDATADAGPPPPAETVEDEDAEEEAAEEGADEGDELEAEEDDPEPEESQEQQEERERSLARPAFPRSPPGVNLPPRTRIRHGESGKTRLEDEEGVLVLSNRKDERTEPQEERGEAPSPEPPSEAEAEEEPAEAHAEPPADQPATVDVPLRPIRKRNKNGEAEADEGGFTWVWGLVGAAAVLLVPIALLLNRGTRPPSTPPVSRRMGTPSVPAGGSRRPSATPAGGSRRPSLEPKKNDEE